METGILPKAGSFEDQDEIFTDCLPVFVQKWKDRQYNRIWLDVHEHTQKVLEAVFPKK